MDSTFRPGHASRRAPDQAFVDCLVSPILPLVKPQPLPPPLVQPPLVKPPQSAYTKTKKRSRDERDLSDGRDNQPVVHDLTLDDSADDEPRQAPDDKPRQAPSAFGSSTCSSDSHDALEFLTTALKSQRLHAPHPSPGDLRKLRVAFFNKLFA